MHRTYDGTTSPTRITWYSDRSRNSQPWRSFRGRNVLDVWDAWLDDYRNPTLAEALKGYQIVERFGQGLEIARRALEANGNPPLEFLFQPPTAPEWVHVTVRKRR